MSGTDRRLPGVFTCQLGWLKKALLPPPAPPANAGVSRCQAPALSRFAAKDHPVVNSTWFCGPTAVDVPPTAVTHGELAGYSTLVPVAAGRLLLSPASPEPT